MKHVAHTMAYKFRFPASGDEAPQEKRKMLNAAWRTNLDPQALEIRTARHMKHVERTMAYNLDSRHWRWELARSEKGWTPNGVQTYILRTGDKNSQEKQNMLNAQWRTNLDSRHWGWERARNEQSWTPAGVQTFILGNGDRNRQEKQTWSNAQWHNKLYSRHWRCEPASKTKWLKAQWRTNLDSRPWRWELASEIKNVERKWRTHPDSRHWGWEPARNEEYWTPLAYKFIF